MRSFFVAISKKIIKKPVLTLFIALICTIALITGVIRFSMATGNETFIKTNTDTYRNNVTLEEKFGGESIVILYKADRMADFLTVDNIAKIDTVEKTLASNEHVYAVISPTTMLNEMTKKQAEMMLEGVEEMRDGLEEMGGKLKDISISIKDMREEIPELDFSQQAANFNQFAEVIDQMIMGQKNLESGVNDLSLGYDEFGTMVLNTGQQVALLGQGFEETFNNLPLPPEEKEQLLKKALGLQQSGAGLTQAGGKMLEISAKSEMLAEVPLQTSQGLEKMKEGLLEQVADLEEKQKNMPDFSMLDELAEGLEIFAENLLTISEGLDTFIENSNIMYPGLPRSQDTLETLLYDDDAELRSVFSQTIIDENHAVMFIKLQGNISDSKKEEVALLAQNEIDKNPLTSVETTVTGKPILDMALRTEMQKSMQRMVLTALILMVIIVSVVFKVRWRLFPLVVNFSAVVATMGLMFYLGISMTMVSMAAFPILIGLGIDYAIQFHNRYEEEFSAQEVEM